MKIVIEISDTLWSGTIRLLRLFQYFFFFTSGAALSLYLLLQLEKNFYQHYYSWSFEQALLGRTASVHEFVQTHFPDNRFAMIWDHIGRLFSAAFGQPVNQPVSGDLDSRKFKVLRRFPSLNTSHLFSDLFSNLPPPGWQGVVLARKRLLGKPAGESRAESRSGHGQVMNLPHLVAAMVSEETLFGKLEVPRLGLSVMVFEGTDERVLRRGAGWVAGSSKPGEIGNVAIAGHRDTFFRPLREIHSGDRIRLWTLRGKFEYVVKWEGVVSPTYIQALAATVEPTLTLITCFPFQYVGPAPKRFLVRAVPVPVSPPEHQSSLSPQVFSQESHETVPQKDKHSML